MGERIHLGRILDDDTQPISDLFSQMSGFVLGHTNHKLVARNFVMPLMVFSHAKGAGPVEMERQSVLKIGAKFRQRPASICEARKLGGCGIKSVWIVPHHEVDRRLPHFAFTAANALSWLRPTCLNRDVSDLTG